MKTKLCPAQQLQGLVQWRKQRELKFKSPITSSFNEMLIFSRITHVKVQSFMPP